jgi:flagellar hook-associated protein 1 FlgK
MSVDGGATFAAAQPFVSGQPIGLVNGAGTLLWQLTVSGTPSDGDLVQVDPTLHPASSNGNALALADLGDAKLVAGANITDAWSNALADFGVRVQSADGAAQQSTAVANDAQARNSGKSGVNLDEEAARLIQYQQSYQAAAKMLQVAQTVFDTLLQLKVG